MQGGTCKFCRIADLNDSYFSAARRNYSSICFQKDNTPGYAFFGYSHMTGYFHCLGNRLLHYTLLWAFVISGVCLLY